jgi:tetratricopeptide (TPR) repeat protein
MGRQEEAREMYERALEMYERLLKSDAENTRFQSYVATTRNNLGALLSVMGRQEEARKMYKRALEMYERLLESDAENTQFQSDVAMTQNNLGALLSDTGRQEEAREMYERALEMRERLLESDAENTQFQSDVAMTQNNLGALLSDMGRQEEARKMYERALEMREQLLKSDAENTQFQSYVATTQNNLGTLLSDTGRQEEAREMYERALEMRERLLKSDAENTQFQSYVATTQNNLGILLGDMGRQEEAREMYGRALEIVKEQKNTHGTGWTLSLLGRLELERDAPDFETARSFLEQGIEKLNREIRPHYPNALNWLALCYYRIGERKKREARKEKTRETAKSLVSDSSQFYKRSCKHYKEAYELPYARMPVELLIDANLADAFASSVQIISEDDDQKAVDILSESIGKIEKAFELAKNNEAQRKRVVGARYDLLAKRSIRSVSLFKEEKEKQEKLLADASGNLINAAQNFEDMQSDKTAASCHGCACLYTDAHEEFKHASDFYKKAESEVGKDVILTINAVVSGIEEYIDALNAGGKLTVAEYLPIYEHINNLVEQISAVGLKNMFKAYIFDEAMNLVDEKMAKPKEGITVIHKGTGDVVIGDKFENIRGATIIKDSLVENSFNKIKEGYGDDVAKALLQIAEFIEGSGNKEAGGLFDSFNEEISKPQPKKSVLKSIWGGIEKALPTITTLSEAIAKLTSLL